MPFFTLLALAAAPSDILVTASRAPVAEREAAVSATVLDAQRIEALGEAADLLAAQEILDLSTARDLLSAAYEGEWTQWTPS